MLGLRLRSELSQRERRVLQAEPRDLLQLGASESRRPLRSRRRTAWSWRVRRAAGADEVRVVGVGEPVRARARGPHDRALLQRERGLARAGGCEDARDPVDALRIGDHVVGALGDAQLATLGGRGGGDRVRALAGLAAHLEMRPTAARSPSPTRAARRARRPSGSTSARRPSAAAGRGAGSARRPRPPAPAPRGRRLRRAAGSASPGRTLAAGRCGSRSGRRTSAGARTPAAPPPGWRGRGGG